MAQSLPVVSVCIPTYNRAGLLGEAIESVLAQTYTDFELIVCDNASEDGTEATVASIRDSRIRYFRNASNEGGRSNWSRCLRESRGQFVSIFPDDDVMLPDNLSKKVSLLTQNATVGLVHSMYAVMTYEGVLVTEGTNKECVGQRVPGTIERGRDVLATLLRHNIIHESTVMFRRGCYERLGGFTDRLTLAFDWEYWMRIASCYDVGFIAKPLVKWRSHSGSLTLAAGRRIAQEPEASLARLQSDLAGLQWVEATYLVKIDKGCRRKVQRCLWRQMGERVAGHAAALLEGGQPMRLVRGFLLEMCHAYPEILIEVEVWKNWLKTLMGSRNITALKRWNPL